MNVSLHALERTSPKGEKFVGFCTKCGKQGLTFAHMNEPCENPLGTSDEQSLTDAIQGATQ